MRTFRAAWGEDGRIAFASDGQKISPLTADCRLARAIEWGTPSDGTALLARLILAHAFDDEGQVEVLGPAFTNLLARMPRHGFAMSQGEVEAWAAQCQFNTAHATDLRRDPL